MLSAIDQQVEDLKRHLSQKWLRPPGSNDGAYFRYPVTDGDSHETNKVELIGAAVGILDVDGPEMCEAESFGEIATKEQVCGAGVDKHRDLN